jgi:hypothetical protein
VEDYFDLFLQQLQEEEVVVVVVVEGLLRVRVR